MVSRHRGSFLAGGWLWYVGGLLAVSGVMSVFRGVIGMGFVTVLIGAGVLVLPVLRWKQTLDIDEGGLTLTKLTGVVKVPREQLKQVTLVHHRSRMGTWDALELVLADGREVEVSGIERAEEAANLVHSLIGGRA